MSESAGLGWKRYARRRDAIPAPARDSDANAYCLYCGSWHFGSAQTRCSHCSSQIYMILATAELRLLRQRSSLHGF